MKKTNPTIRTRMDPMCLLKAQGGDEARGRDKAGPNDKAGKGDKGND